MVIYEIPFIILFSLIFTRLNHPLSTGLVLLVQTVLISVGSGLFRKRYWFSYILFLIFLGGMLVLFIYVASLAANEQFKVKRSIGLILLLGGGIRGALFFLDPVVLTNKINISISRFVSDYFDIREGAFRVRAIYNTPRMCFTLFIIRYLLLALFVVVNLIRRSSGPLRLITYDSTLA